jgi:hypothetical protein
LGLALAFLWYANSEWRAASRVPEVRTAQMTKLPDQPPPSAKRPE